MSHTGWKLLHADVFRPPPQRTMFTALVGTGTQLLVMSFALILIGCVDHYNPGTVLSTAAFLYVVSSLVAGYVAGNLYETLGGQKVAGEFFYQTRRRGICVL